jgi:hypothetical protein
MMKKRFVLCFIFGFFLFLAGCASKTDLRPQRDCPIKELLLDQSDYPPDSVFDTIDSPIADKPLESAGQSAYYKNSWTDQTVVRYYSNDNAIAEYEKVQKIVFDPREVVGSWKIPPVLGFNNLSLDRYEIACGNVISFGERCYMIGQNEEYYIFFRANISNDGVTYELFRDLVLKIDNEVASCVDHK